MDNSTDHFQNTFASSSIANFESRYPEAVVRRCSVKKVFLKKSQNLKENTYARISFLIKSQGQQYY